MGPLSNYIHYSSREIQQCYIRKQMYDGAKLHKHVQYTILLYKHVLVCDRLFHNSFWKRSFSFDLRLWRQLQLGHEYMVLVELVRYFVNNYKFTLLTSIIYDLTRYATQTLVHISTSNTITIFIAQMLASCVHNHNSKPKVFLKPVMKQSITQ